MGLSRFPTMMPIAAQATIDTANALRLVRDSSGDLTFRDLDNIQTGLAESKTTCFTAYSEGMKQKAGAEAFMATLGGPATLKSFMTAMKGIEVNAAAWNAAVKNMLSTLSADDLIELRIEGSAPLTYKMVRHKHFIPAVKADPLRKSKALSDLITSFEAVGAV